MFACLKYDATRRLHAAVGHSCRDATSSLSLASLLRQSDVMRRAQQCVPGGHFDLF